MSDSRVDARFDALASQVHDWVDSAVALDAGHFPAEMVSDLKDIIEELKTFLEEEESGEYNRASVVELFVTPEMAEVVDRFPRVRRMLEQAWGQRITELIEEEGAGYSSPDDDEDDDED